MRSYSIAGLAFALFLCFASESRAGLQITYSETFTGSGTYTPSGGSADSFNNKLVTISISGNTSNVVTVDPTYGIYSLSGTATVTIATVGSLTMSDTFTVAVDQRMNPSNPSTQANTIAFGDDTNPAAPVPLFVGTAIGNQFASYDLKSYLGPIATTPTAPILQQTFGTVGGGSLKIKPILTDPSTFSAAPEPSTIGMAVVGLGSLGVRVLSRAGRRKLLTACKTQ